MKQLDVSNMSYIVCEMCEMCEMCERCERCEMTMILAKRKQSNFNDDKDIITLSSRAVSRQRMIFLYRSGQTHQLKSRKVALEAG